jgi:hypothetical protein
MESTDAHHQSTTQPTQQAAREGTFIVAGPVAKPPDHEGSVPWTSARCAAAGGFPADDMYTRGTRASTVWYHVTASTRAASLVNELQLDGSTGRRVDGSTGRRSKLRRSGLNDRSRAAVRVGVRSVVHPTCIQTMPLLAAKATNRTLGALMRKGLGSALVLVRGPFRVERVTGIEPALSAWEADVLPLNYTRKRRNGRLGSLCPRRAAALNAPPNARSWPWTGTPMPQSVPCAGRSRRPKSS